MENIILYALCLISLVLVISALYLKRDDVRRRMKESFISTPNKAIISEAGAIRSHNLLTNGMTNRTPEDLLEQAKSGYVVDDDRIIGLGYGDNFDNVYRSHVDIQNIDKRGNNGYHNTKDLDEISRKILSNTNNARTNMFTRAGTKPTKLIIEPNGIRGVIEAKYLPERDRNQQITVVQSAVPVQGYDVNIERLGENLMDTHFGKISRNVGTKRTPTAAGATNTEGILPNESAIDSNIGYQGNNVAFVDNLTGKTILAPMNKNANKDEQRTVYTKGDTTVRG